MCKTKIDEFSFEELKKLKFRIPLYQRDYAWGDKEVEQLLNDLQESKKSDYYIGNIVVEKQDDIYDVIDGQQRLTTLYLIAKVAKENCFSLDYEIRDEDRDFLENLQIENNKITPEYNGGNDKFIPNIKKIIEFENLKDLINKCKITLTILGDDLDIEKYFEVMNNRGKQLEKHQILKANFLRVLKDNKDYDYAKIWDYCSDMDSFVEDLINPNEDDKIIKVRENLLNFKETDYFKDENKQNEKKSILEIIKSEEEQSEEEQSEEEQSEEEQSEEEQSEEDIKHTNSHHSIVKFPVFLLHVLRLYAKQETISLNDNKLLETFDFKERFKEDKTEAEKFILFMLRTRILFDYFVLKRDDKGKLVFSSKCPFNDTNKNLLMIQSLFYVNADYFTQGWLTNILEWLDKNYKQDDFYNNYLAELKIQENNLMQGKLEDRLLPNLNLGTNTPRYWFYKLEYLLWEQDNKKEKKKYGDFKFTFGSSVEHFMPQNQLVAVNTNIEKNVLDNFGNLCLISSGSNSRYSNHSPQEKANMWKKNKVNESIKQSIMMYQADNWDKDDIEKHGEEMIKILKESINETK